MRKVLQAKFEQHPDLMEKLVATRSPLVEYNDWNDKFWGVCDGVGHNCLGRLLMELRYAEWIKRGIVEK